jgi:two-component system sensor histidine kinase ChvG
MVSVIASAKHNRILVLMPNSSQPQSFWSRWRMSIARERLRALWRIVTMRASSSLVRRIAVLNLAGLVALLIGFLYLSQYREGLIDARVQSMLTQGEIIAAAISASATLETNSLTIDPNKLLQLQPGESFITDDDQVLEFSLNPEKVAQLLRRVVTPTRTRARIYDLDGVLLLDSRGFYRVGDVLRLDLPPPEPHTHFFARQWIRLKQWMGWSPTYLAEEISASNGNNLPEVVHALNGRPATATRMNARGETIVSVAVPVLKFRAVRGVLLLSTQGGEIDRAIMNERLAILRSFALAAIGMVVVSVLFAGTIAGPIRRLSAGADRVRRGVKAREEIPDFTDRSDEIGHLSGSLRDMTRALYDRIEAIERFAADVAHELKNPLTSLRSAVETLPLAKNDQSRERLLSVIQHDIKRLDRLISDISDASRLDAELARNEMQPVDLVRLLEIVTEVANVGRSDAAPVTLTIDPDLKNNPRRAQIMGHESRLGQVIDNLIANARSFSPDNSSVRISLERQADNLLIRVEDDGPGIPPHALERIFERFYTDRPDQGFGQHSGLGLSISRQIMGAHEGTIKAENRMAPAEQAAEPACIGARFTLTLPALA